jgi:hypothetical protein
MWRALYVLQQENNNMRRAFEQLQAGAPPTPQNPGGATYRRNLIGHDLNFEVLSIKFNLYSDYNLDSIQ